MTLSCAYFIPYWLKGMVHAISPGKTTIKVDGPGELIILFKQVKITGDNDGNIQEQVSGRTQGVNRQQCRARARHGNQCKMHGGPESHIGEHGVCKYHSNKPFEFPRQ